MTHRKSSGNIIVKARERKLIERVKLVIPPMAKVGHSERMRCESASLHYTSMDL